MDFLRIKNSRPDVGTIYRALAWSSTGFIFFTFLIPYIYTAQFHRSGLDLGMILSLRMIGSMASSLIVGFLADSVQKERLIALGSVVRAVSLFLIYFALVAGCFGLFQTALLIQSLCAGLYYTVGNSILAEKATAAKRLAVFGLKDRSFAIGEFIGTLIGMPIFLFGSYFLPANLALVYFPLILYGLANLYAAGLFLIADKKTPILTPASSEDKFAVETLPNHESCRPHMDQHALSLVGAGTLLLYAVFFIAGVNNCLATPFVQSFIMVRFDAVPAYFTLLIFAPAEIIALFLQPYVIRYVEKLSLYTVIALVFFSGALFTALLLVTAQFWLVGVILALDMTCAKAGTNILFGAIGQISRGHRSKLYGLLQAISTLGAMIGPLLGGFLWDNWGVFVPFWISVGVEALLILPYWKAVSLLQGGLPPPLSSPHPPLQRDPPSPNQTPEI